MGCGFFFFLIETVDVLLLYCIAKRVVGIYCSVYRISYFGSLILGNLGVVDDCALDIHEQYYT
jgi:hypothetical protein